MKTLFFFEKRKCTNKILIRKNENQLNFRFYVAKYVFGNMTKIRKNAVREFREYMEKHLKPTQKEEVIFFYFQPGTVR